MRDIGQFGYTGRINELLKKKRREERKKRRGNNNENNEEVGVREPRRPRGPHNDSGAEVVPTYEN